MTSVFTSKVNNIIFFFSRQVFFLILNLATADRLHSKARYGGSIIKIEFHRYIVHQDGIDFKI